MNSKDFMISLSQLLTGFRLIGSLHVLDAARYCCGYTVVRDSYFSDNYYRVLINSRDIFDSLAKLLK